MGKEEVFLIKRS